jgi:RHS repeat-associated protein
MIGDTYGVYGSFYTWEITSMMKAWYDDQNTNYGLLIKGESTTAGYRTLFSANALYVDDQVQTIIQYVNTAGLEDCWSYQSMDARRAGTANVNLFTGNLVVSHDDIGTDGNRMPVSISHVYNAVEKDANIGYGMGWRLNYTQTIASQTISGVLYYKYTDEDGTVHYFKQNGTTYEDESGQNRKLELNKSITDIDGNVVPYNFIITDKSDNVLCFDSSGRLVKIKDAVGNYIAITYGTGNRITLISDGARRTYSLGYNAANNLQSINVSGPRAITYAYDASNRLTTITYSGGQQTLYSYNVTSNNLNNTLSKLQNIDGYNLAISYAYSTYKYPKVSGIQEWGDAAHTAQGQGGSQSFTYYPKQTKVQDHLGNINYYVFNQYGNAVSIQDDEGRAVYCQFYSPTAATPSGGTYGQNKMSLSSRLQEPVMNYVKDNNFDTDSYWDDMLFNAGGSIARTSSESKFGYYSAQIVNTSNAGYNYLTQAVNVPSIGETYVLSAWVKTSGIVATGSWGATLEAKYLTTGGMYRFAYAKALAGTNDWTRIDIPFTVASDAASTQVYITLMNAYCTGTAWYDGVQLEQSSVVNRLNLLQNGDMSISSSGTPTFWTKGAGCTAADTATTNTDTGRGSLDNNVFMFNGSPTVDKSLSQTVLITGISGDCLSIGGWAKHYSVPLGTKYPIGTSGTSYGRNLGIKVELKNVSTVVGSATVSFNAFATGLWQYASGRVVATGAYDRAVVTLLYDNQDNYAYFDGIQLYKEEFGQCYDYDSKGNLITAKDLSSNTNSITYDSTTNEPTSLKPPDCSDTQKYTTTYYTGAKSHLVNTTKTPMGINNRYTYDDYGNVLTSTIENNPTTLTAFIRTYVEYTSDGNYLSKSFDSRGYNSQYSYDANFGLNDSTRDPMGQVVNYTYDKATTKRGLLTSVSSTTNGTTYTNGYGYTNDLLTSITHNGFSYNIAYNPFGQTTGVSVAGQNLVTNTYITSDRSYLLDYLTYGNDGRVDYTYDSRYRVSAIKYDNEATPRYKYTYGANGQLGTVNDTQNNLLTTLYYDLADRPMKTVEKYPTFMRSFQYTYDMDNCLTRFLEQFGATAYDTKLTYDKDNRITAVDYGSHAAGSENVRYVYDALDRLQTRTLETGATDYVLTYNYLNGPTGWAPANAARTNMISSISYNGASSLSYTYDGCGRILTVGNGTNTIHYAYDGLGQLTRVDDPTDTRGGASGSTWTYAYDAGGNMTVKNLYEHCYGDNDLTDNTVVDSFAYGYDATWKDKLTSYDGNAITYDEIGNPLTYDGWTYTWEAGRQLKQMSDGTTTVQFKYNNAGLRTQKINGATTTSYYWAGNSITHMTDGTNTLHFYYDAAGKPAMVKYGADCYYYLTNQQGDIIGFVDGSGSIVVSYTYDSWGKQLSCTGSMASTLGELNPFRYRGYIYDSETGLYYLQSRYYNPEIGRMLNADNVSIIATQDDILETNLFIYCTNDPINNTDDNGSWKLPNWAKIVIGAVAVAAAVTVTVATGGAAAPLLIGVAVSTLSSAAIGGAVGYATGGIKGMKRGIVDGACDGFMWGGVGAAGAAVGRVVQIAKKGVVIGESMSRVNRVARHTQAATYKGMPGYKAVKFFKGEAAANKMGMANNEAWINRMMKYGVKISDIGLDSARAVRSPSYFMESMLTRGYSNLNIIH